MSPTSFQDAPLEAPATPAGVADILVCLPSLSSEALQASLETIAATFPGEPILVASPNVLPTIDTDQPNPNNLSTLTLIAHPADNSSSPGWVLTASDYASAAALASSYNTPTLMLLGAQPTSPAFLRALADSSRSMIDLTVPRFNIGPSDSLVNSALLYPLTRALFGADIHFPLPIDAALSPRMAQRLASSAQRLIAINQGGSLLWPAAEASVAGLSIREIDAEGTLPPSPPQVDFNTLFGSVAGSLFTDIEARASFWQRARPLPVRPLSTPFAPSIEAEIVSPDILSIIENFHIAQANLQEIWSLVLPPQSRLAFKKLSQLPPSAFSMDPALWARTVYDFCLAFHLRTLNRNHLLGAMTPLYLAWVASHLRSVADDPTRAQKSIEQTAAAFESEKSYFVSRWRWPDRFNP
jgi:hypothetical protein